MDCALGLSWVHKCLYVHGSHIFLVKVELILPGVWVHPKIVTCKIIFSERYIHGNHTGLGTWAVVPARQLWDVVVELLHTLHKLTNADSLGLLKHICYVAALAQPCCLGTQ